MYTMGDLKHLCNILRVDYKTRMIAYGLFNSSRKAAFSYVEGYPRRNYIEEQRIQPSFGAG